MSRILMIFIFLSAGSSFTNDGLIKAGSGFVNYNKNIVQATGIGKSYEAAIIDARSRLIETALGALIKSETFVENENGISDIKNKNITQMVQGHILREKVIDEVRRVNGFTEVTMIASLGDISSNKNLFSNINIAKNLSPYNPPESSHLEESQQPIVLEQLVQPALGEEVNNEKSDSLVEEILEPKKLEHSQYINEEEPQTLYSRKEETSEQLYTSLIVDVEGYAITPDRVIRIFDERKNEVYGYMTKSYNENDMTGMAGFALTLEEAMKHERAGENPLVIRAIDKLDDVSVVIKQEHADFIKDISKNLRFLDDAKVIFIL